MLFRSINYIENEWSSLPLCASDRISSKEIKTQQNISTCDLLIETLIRESNKDDNFNSSEVPLKFLTLIDTNIINKADDIDSNKNKDLWIALGKWLGFEGPIKRKEV